MLGLGLSISEPRAETLSTPLSRSSKRKTPRQGYMCKHTVGEPPVRGARNAGTHSPPWQRRDGTKVGGSLLPRPGSLEKFLQGCWGVFSQLSEKFSFPDVLMNFRAGAANWGCGPIRLPAAEGLQGTCSCSPRHLTALQQSGPTF